MHKARPVDISMETLHQLVCQHPNIPYRDLIWGEWNRLLSNYIKEKNFGSYRNIKYAMHRFLVEENRHMDSISFLAEAFFLDLNGSNSPFVAPALIENFQYLVKTKNITEDQLTEIISLCLEKVYAPYKNYTLIDSVKIMVAYAFEKKDEAEKIFYKIKS